MGVNGWAENGHDASSVLLEVTKDNCKILGALEEEKITRKKCAFDTFPVNSVQYLLDSFDLKVEDIDYIAYGWNYPKVYELASKPFPYLDNMLLLKELFPHSDIKKNIPIEYIDHHLAHAACSYRTSHFTESLIIVVDGQGETESSSIWIGKNNQINLLTKIDIKESLGYLYEAVNSILNFKNHESGKTMGLAPYGQPRFLQVFEDHFNFTNVFSFNDEMNDYYKAVSRFSPKNALNDQQKIITMWQYFIKDKLDIDRRNSAINSFYEVGKDYKDLAASVQCLLENHVIKLVENYVKQTGLANVCLSGGVALNCIMNGKILKQSFVNDIFINPAANDAGVALGAALELANKLGFKSKIDGNCFSPFLGIEFTNDEVINQLKIHGLKYKIYSNASEYIATSIENNKIVAIFQGKNEWGPRALGNRTILSSARERKRLDYINNSIKERESGRPLGPSILVEDSDLFLKQPKSLGRYMNIAYEAEKNVDKYPAVIHVDKTFRPEFVEQSFNSTYYEQLKAIKKITGHSIVINTSFNLKTPIIFHIEDAIQYFNSSNIDALVFNNQIVLEKL
ncbi:carbamoyltransferase C-terminal domain-containing protein [Brevibacillus laterosporus]|uniref:carbamoyltransferase C-terminal domain-containing protein n=1 Tax=Brevibacillus laterosporus TaxID=1465 RepID=UPI001315A3D0|nr:carbamoyltransferase C-terminal domain-containing protein [Brevibacillus laterosporus]